MKKINPTIYAEFLLRLLEREDSLESSCHKFISILARNNQLSALGTVIRKFSKLYNQKENTVDVEIESPFVLSEKVGQKLNELVRVISGKDKVVPKYNIKPELLSGVRFSFEDYRIDGSGKRFLENLKSEF